MKAHLPIKKNAGLTLVEIIVAIAVFSIIMLALSGTIVSGLQLRRNNNLDAQALAYASTILESFKNQWSNSANFKDGSSPIFPAFTPPDGLQEARIDFEIQTSCWKFDSSYQAVQQAAGSNDCDFRRVKVDITDTSGKARGGLETEIGNPKQ
jgi:prepilin-type N-terminal cleavage/methylation domain-containing protein